MHSRQGVGVECVAVALAGKKLQLRLSIRLPVPNQQIICKMQNVAGFL
jgi:hypothetical protein